MSVQAPLHHTWMVPGEGAPIVLIHGFGSSISGWQPFLSALPAGHPVLAVDLPGHGRSALGPEISLEAFATAVESTLVIAGAKSPHLIGHSLGGAVATLLAHRGALVPRSLALLSPAGLGAEINGEFLQGFTSARSEETLAPWMQQLFADPALLEPAFIRATLRPRRDENFVAGQLRVIAALFPDGAQASSIRPHLERITIPIRIVFGRADRVIPAQHAALLPDHIKLDLLDEVGHLPYLEAREELARMVAELIRIGG